jgi:hypothetical protein
MLSAGVAIRQQLWMISVSVKRHFGREERAPTCQSITGPAEASIESIHLGRGPIPVREPAKKGRSDGRCGLKRDPR